MSTRVGWPRVAALAVGLLLAGSPDAATITIVNADAGGEGFNDPTVVAPEGGNLGVTRGQQRLNLFQAAAAVWAATLQSNIEIKVNAQFNPLFCTMGSAVLGSAGPNGLVRDFPSAPQANTWYHIALAESLANANFNTTEVEINATFNSAIDTGCFGFPPNERRWWYGTNPAIPPAANTVVLFPVVLHELGHGLGFSAQVCVSTGGCGGPPQGSLLDGRNDSWTRFLRDVEVGLNWDAMSDAQRAASLINDPDLVWIGAQVTAAIPTFAPTGAGLNGAGVNARMRMHAPNPVVPGSSVSHFTSAAANPDLLMEPSLSTGLFNATDMTVPLFRDIGWQILGGANQPPVITRPVSLTVTEDVASAITGVSVADPDAASGNVTLTFSVGAGTFNSPGCVSVTSGGTASARTLSGTLANLNTCLGGSSFQYTTAANSTTSVVMTINANDNGNTGTGGAMSDTEMTTLNVTAVNDAPVNTVPASIAVNEDAATGLTGISFADVDIAAGNLQVTLGVPSGSISFPVCTGVSVGGTATARTLTGTLAQINACFAGVSRPTFTTAANATANVNLTVTSSDLGNTGTGGALGDSDVVSLNVTAVNDAPVNTVPASIAVNEDVATGLAGISFADVDIAAASLQVTLGVPGGSINSPTCTGVVASGSATARVLTGTLAQVNACFAGGSRPTYTTAANATANVNLTVTSNDLGNTGTGGALTDADVVALNVTAVNDAPVNTVPASIAVNEDAPTGLTGISFADVDIAAGNLQVTLGVPGGSISSPTCAGVVASGSATSRVLTGTLAQVNACFAGASRPTFTTAPDATADVNLTVTSGDNGNTGTGGALGDTDVVTLDVAAVNDPPTVTLPSSIPVTVPGTSPLRNIVVADIDSAGAAVTATLTVPVGTLSATSGGGVTVVGSGTPTVVLTGTIANLAAYFDADLVSYTAGGDTTLTVTLNDQGNTGSGGAQSAVAMTPLVGDAIFSNGFE